MAQQLDKEFNPWKLLWIPVLIFVIMLVNPVVIVGPGERGVVLTWGA